METQHAKEEVKKLRTSVTELRDKLAELETRVRSIGSGMSIRRQTNMLGISRNFCFLVSFM